MDGRSSNTLPLSERARRELADRIVTGDIAPGTRLDEQQLAATFGFSRTPLRDALKLLSGDGLVELLPRRGAFVKMLTEADLTDLLEALTEVEAACARLAAARMSKIERHRLTELHEQCLDASERRDLSDYAGLNREFHVELCAGGHNSVLADTAHQLRIRAAPFRRFAFFNSERLTTSIVEHAAIVEAITNEDPDAAAAAANAHLTTSGVNALSVVDLGGGDNAQPPVRNPRRPA